MAGTSLRNIIVVGGSFVGRVSLSTGYYNCDCLANNRLVDGSRACKDHSTNSQGMLRGLILKNSRSNYSTNHYQ